MLAALPVTLPDPEVQQLVARLMRSAEEHDRLMMEGLVSTQRIRDDALRVLFGEQG
ncbi:hypothetical protein ABH931_000509 [Streptacidiphilus sp. MAP12-33]|uniref:hypothetical protein n=1 Tax=Streptacidiphilus sp. MAP12-33 TaxID=3156266 RepID=UPI0035124BD0